jgi:D-alanyl-D-alanine carboxypeptidase (penicillin-binding protein 5/6)
MKKLKTWAIVIILLLTYTICPMKQTYASDLDTTQSEATENEESQAEDSQTEETQPEAGAGTTDNTALFDSAGVMVSAPSAILMEASTGTIIYEKNSKEQLRPASITKIMTLILIFDALEAGKIALEDTVTVSEYAASMGGSQVFFEPGETQTVETMIKCIAVASANDACVAMAEHICGNETEFVNQMNERAKGLGMNNTHFINCNGLDADGHMTTAYDVALMSRELIVKYPLIHNYSTIWMENITHVTKKGSSEFGLTNTNKLIKQYEYATGLKTGSTSLAKYCVSATAKKNDIELIAVIMAAPDYKVRFQDATTLLNFGYGKCQVYSDDSQETLPLLTVKKGIERSVACEYEDTFKYLDATGADLSTIEKEMQLVESVDAPINKGDVVGKLVYKLNGKEIGYTKILFSVSVDKAEYMDYFIRTLKLFVL